MSNTNKIVTDFGKFSWFKKFLMRYLGWIMYVGHENHSWKQHAPFYARWCSECKHYCKNYEQGESRMIRCYHRKK